MKNMFNFLKEVKSEIKQINWPTQKTTTNFTLAVIFIAFVFAVYLGVVDAGFSKLLSFLI